MNPHLARWRHHLKDCSTLLGIAEPVLSAGCVTRVTGLAMEASGLRLPVGSVVSVVLQSGGEVEAEVVGFRDDRLLLMPQGQTDGVAPGARVTALETAALLPGAGKVSHPRRRSADHMRHLPAGPQLLGRVVDAAGRPLDGLGRLDTGIAAPLNARAPNPLDRAPIDTVLDVGVRAINGVLTVGRGQRIGLFAGSGVGKSVLLGMMARYTTADVVVVGLIGERGREVKEFIEQILGEDGRARSAVVAAPADAPPLLRLQGAAYATAIAEHFRDQGKHVLLIMDSLTRYAMAQREIALAVGEPPATKGYPPSVFAKLPARVERTGNGREGSGSITAFYTVLSEGDDQQDPIADAARAILDGHIVLSRTLAESGHYPAIDVEASASRVMHNVASPQHLELARKFRNNYSRFMKSRDLIQLGAYVAGSDPETDRAIVLYPALQRFLMQDMREAATLPASLQQLGAALQDEPRQGHAQRNARPQHNPYET